MIGFHQYNKEPQIIKNSRINFEPHFHNDVEIIAMLSGTAYAIVDGKQYTLESGDFIIVFPDIIHSYRTDNPVEVEKFIFDPILLTELNNIFEKTIPKTPLIRKSELYNSGIPLLAEEIISNYHNSSRAVKSGYLILLTGKLIELCSLLPRDNTTIGAVNQILVFCRNNYKNQITIEKISSELFLSKSYISHIFSDKLKIGFRDYINILRINEAERLLNESELSITDISELCGFGSIRSFNRAFYKYHNIPPKKFRI